MSDRKILIVDDEQGFRQMLEWNLGRDGVQVHTAADGREAEMMLEKEGNAGVPYALVITDITMPRLDGLKLLRSIKRSFPATHVILMTGFGTVESAVQAMKEGAADFILKPFDLEGMVARVRGILGLGAAKAPQQT